MKSPTAVCLKDVCRLSIVTVVEESNDALRRDLVETECTAQGTHTHTHML